MGRTYALALLRVRAREAARAGRTARRVHLVQDPVRVVAILGDRRVRVRRVCRRRRRRILTAFLLLGLLVPLLLGLLLLLRLLLLGESVLLLDHDLLYAGQGGEHRLLPPHHVVDFLQRRQRRRDAFALGLMRATAEVPRELQRAAAVLGNLNEGVSMYPVK